MVFSADFFIFSADKSNFSVNKFIKSADKIMVFDKEIVSSADKLLPILRADFRDDTSFYLVLV